jgi:hypothetical protein
LHDTLILLRRGSCGCGETVSIASLSGAPRRQRHVAGALKLYLQVHKEPTLSTIISMACRISTVPSTLICSSSGAPRVVWRLRSSQCSLALSSRASCSWTRNDSIGRRQALLTPRSRTTYCLQQARIFSTSLRHNAERQDGKNATSQDLPEQKKEVGHSIPSALLHYRHSSIFLIQSPAYYDISSMTRRYITSCEDSCPSDEVEEKM